MEVQQHNIGQVYPAHTDSFLACLGSQNIMPVFFKVMFD